MKNSIPHNDHTAVSVATEETPLLSQQSRVVPATPISPLRKYATYALCAGIAVPTAVLGALSFLTDDPSQLTKLHSLDDLENLFATASTNQLMESAIAFSLAEAVFIYMNTLYFPPSAQAAYSFIKRFSKTAAYTLSCRSHKLKKEDHIPFTETFLFAWSIGTTLIFAQMGSDALSFLGGPGKIAGYTASFAAYFATRYVSSVSFFEGSQRLKQGYFDKFELLASDAKIQETRVDNQNTSAALVKFLKQIDHQWLMLPKDPKKMFWLDQVAPLMGYFCMAITALPIMTCLIPLAVQGAESQTSWDIGRSADYQNMTSLSFGAFVTALTVFFYELSIKDLPKHSIRTALLMDEEIKNGNNTIAVKLFFMTLIVLGASFSTGFGFKMVADNTFANGYLSYLPDGLSQWMPDGLCIATAFMLWSHLQNLVNQTFKPQQPPVDSQSVKEVTLSNVGSLLKQQNSFSALLGWRRSGVFGLRGHSNSSGQVEEMQIQQTSHTIQKQS